MQTHEDETHRDETRHQFWDRLRKRARKTVHDKASEITCGKEGEEPLGEWIHDGVGVRHMPPDEQGILRVSVGGGQTPIPMNYCVFRGDLGPCIDLLEKAIKALRAADDTH